MSPDTSEAKQPVFYGWVVVSTVFFMLAITSGLGFYNASVILSAAKDELGVSVTVVSGATAMFFGVSGIMGFALSRLMDRVDLRWFYAVGGVVGGLCLTSLRWVDSVFELYLFFTVFGTAFATAGLVPGTTLVARWFSVRRSVALSIASTGLSVGGIAITPFIATFIDNRGLAGAGPWMGLIWFVGLLPLSFIFIRSYPSDKGLEPDGAPRPPEPVPLVGATFAEAISTRFFRFLSATYALVFLAQVGAIAQMYNLVEGRVDARTATASVSTLALSSVVGRLSGGVVVAKIPTRQLTAALILVQAVALALMAQAETRTAVLVAAAVFGLSVGNLLMLQPLLLAETFGVKEYSRIYSFNQLFGTIGVAGGPFVLGYMRDLVDYTFSFTVAAGANLIGFAMLIMAGSVEDARASWSDSVFEGVEGSVAGADVDATVPNSRR